MPEKKYDTDVGVLKSLYLWTHYMIILLVFHPYLAMNNQVIVLAEVQINKYYVERKIVSIFLSISSNICFGCSKEPFH